MMKLLQRAGQPAELSQILAHGSAARHYAADIALYSRHFGSSEIMFDGSLPS
ncbi:MAG: hypothetical protein AAF914_12710 [Pseudomonadota bacterium]